MQMDVINCNGKAVMQRKNIEPEMRLFQRTTDAATCQPAIDLIPRDLKREMMELSLGDFNQIQGKCLTLTISQIHANKMKKEEEELTAQ